MNNYYALIVVMLPILSFTDHAIAGQPSIKNAFFHSGVLTAEFDTGGEDLWIGASWRDEDGDIHDLSPIRVSGTTTRATWTIARLLGTINTEIDARVSLWEGRNGRQMRGRVADTGWFCMAHGY
jgi:hypothetical protein